MPQNALGYSWLLVSDDGSCTAALALTLSIAPLSLPLLTLQTKPASTKDLQAPVRTTVYISIFDLSARAIPVNDAGATCTLGGQPLIVLYMEIRHHWGRDVPASVTKQTSDV